eukprot:5216268-Ditylum_brightwellii.AAC.1
MSTMCKLSLEHSFIMSDELCKVPLKLPPRMNLSPFVCDFFIQASRSEVNVFLGLIVEFVSDCCTARWFVSSYHVNVALFKTYGPSQFIVMLHWNRSAAKLYQRLGER